MSSEPQRSRAELVEEAQKMLARHGRRVPEDAQDRAVYEEDRLLAVHCTSISHATEHVKREMSEIGYRPEQRIAATVATSLFSARYVGEIFGDRQDSEPVSVARIRAVVEQLVLQGDILVVESLADLAESNYTRGETRIRRAAIDGKWVVLHDGALLAPRFAWRGSARKHARDIALCISDPIYARDMDSDRAEDR
jgi:hypothetical protein